jgi:hypothetical protein
LQRLAQLVEPAEEDGLPRIPGEQAKDETATRAHDLHRHQHERVEKCFEFHAQDRGFLGRVPDGPPSRLRQPQNRGHGRPATAVTGEGGTGPAPVELTVVHEFYP